MANSREIISDLKLENKNLRIIIKEYKRRLATTGATPQALGEETKNDWKRPGATIAMDKEEWNNRKITMEESQREKIKQLEKSISIYQQHTNTLEEEVEQLTERLNGSKDVAWQIIEAKNMVIFKDGSMGKLTEGGKFVCKLAGVEPFLFNGNPQDAYRHFHDLDGGD